MEISVQQIDQLLHAKKRKLRKANDDDIIFIKNELYSLIKGKREHEQSQHIKQILSNIHYMNISVESENEESVMYYYEPQRKYKKKMKLHDSGWIEIDK